jgi:hypothetical protein
VSVSGAEQAVSGTVSTFEVALTNDPGNVEPFTGIDVTLPAGFHAVSASRGDVAGRVIRLRGLSVAGGQTLRVTVKAAVPVRCHAASYGWQTTVWENDGNFPGGRESLTLTSGAPSTRVVGGCLRRYALRISPSTVPGGTSAKLTFALRNSSSGGIPLGSAAFVAPHGFTVTHASLAGGARGSVSVTAGVVHLSGLKLKSGRTLAVVVTAVPAEKCGSAAYRWGSAAANGGRSLALQPGSSHRSTSVATTCALRFAIQPHNAVVDQAISGFDYVPSGPPVAVAIVDGFGNVVKSSNAAVSIGLHSNPGGANLAGRATATTVGGVASFGGLSLDRPQNRYALSAASPGLAGANSTPFDENNTENPCLQNVTCQTQLVNAASQMSVTANPDTTQTNDGTLAESINVGAPLQCSGYAQEDPNWYEFLMSSANRTKTLDYIIKQPAIPLEGTVNAILSLTQFCLEAPYEFTTSAGTPAAPTTLPDGTSGFVGLLPTCGSGGSPPCIASKSSQLDLNNALGFDIVLQIDLPEGRAGDPRGRA